LFGGAPTAEVLTAAASLGLLIANILLINEVPDERADRSAGKRTLVVRLGRARATQLFGSLFVVAFTLPVIGYFATGKIALLGLLGGAVPADFAAAQLAREPSRPPIEAQGMAIVAYVIAGAMMSLLLWIG
jgi:1,4-dihydroxy-2-naphthoate octaprenyltransferase